MSGESKGAFPAVPELRNLRNSSLQELEHLAQDIRQKILSTCLRNGGHLGASLGTVELTIALHCAFDSPSVPLVWDVGHQAYAHKLLTGRWDRFETLRQAGGLSGFLSREESEHDVFGAGHSGTALSAALAMAWVRRRENTRWTVAIVGDGSLTAGVTQEALNNVRALALGPLLLVVNDNQMSISENVGAIPGILSGGEAAKYFDLLGFDYLGPIDGHDLRSLLLTLQEVRKGYAGRPVVLHVLTQKGKGYGPAEELPAAFHGVSPIQKETKIRSSAEALGAPKGYSDVFGAALCALAEQDARLVAITAAMPDGTGLVEFSRKFPDRFFDTGIAEPHAVIFAAGLATQGLRPVVAIYSTFLQRAFDAIIHDVALQKLPVIFAIDRGGIVGADGPTHHGAFDLAYLGLIPELIVTAAACQADVEFLLKTALAGNAPFALRYPRGSGPVVLETPLVDGVRWHQQPRDPKVIVIALGAATPRALAALRSLGQDAGPVCMISTIQAKPLPKSLLDFVARNPGVPVLSIEDGILRGGFGQALAAAAGQRTGVWSALGFDDHFISHGAPAELEQREGLSAAKIAERIKRFL